MSNITSLKKQLGLNAILSSLDSNPKVSKSNKLGVSTAVLHLAPASLSGYNTCPGSSQGCRDACLHYAGSVLYYDNKTKARIAKTQAFFKHRQAFLNLLALELDAHVKRCAKNNMEAAMRLNATSDIRWEAMRFELYDWVAKKINRTGDNIIDMFKADCSPYDYTKLFNRKVPEGYHLTYSLSEGNLDNIKKMLEAGHNAAVVFQGKMPDKYLGYPVIDGDEHDYRPADPKGSIVGLKAKGKLGREDTTGFVVLL